MAAPNTEIPNYAAGAQPQYEYDPNSGYIVPGQFDDASADDKEHNETTSTSTLAQRSGQSAANPADSGHPATEPEEYDEDYEEDDEELFEDEMDEPDWSNANGDFTKSYNRQRRLVEATQATQAGTTGPAAPKMNPKPKANVAARVDDQIQSLTKFAARIKLDDAQAGMSGKGSGGGGHDKSDRATSEQVLDPRTRMILLQLINRSILHSINGVLSTGKEANVYHALADPPQDSSSSSPLHRAVKVYKTSILVFKDRDRYVSGEFRFRHGYNKSNNRSMVKVWAEKEMRNLKRIWASGIPCPEPICLRLHVLVMGFIGDKKGWPAPRLRDAGIEDVNVFDSLYIDLLTYMRIMYHVCRLVHADLSEYNLLYYKSKLYIIDVSQSVEHDHPRSSEFLRMDIKNITDYFKRQGVDVYAERTVFEFITSSDHGVKEEGIRSVLEGLERDGAKVADEEEGAAQEVDEKVFRQVYIPRTLEEVYDFERDAAKVHRGEGQNLIYKDLLAGGATVGTDKEDGGVKISHEVSGEDEAGTEEEDEEEDEEDEDEGEEEVDDDGNPMKKEFKEKAPRGKKHEDKEEKKVSYFSSQLPLRLFCSLHGLAQAHKAKVKEEKREARKQKMPKHIKKKLVSQSKK